MATVEDLLDTHMGYIREELGQINGKLGAIDKKNGEQDKEITKIDKELTRVKMNSGFIAIGLTVVTNLVAGIVAWFMFLKRMGS